MAYLAKCEGDRRWVARHDRKVRRSLVAYALGLVLICTLGYQMNFGQIGQNVEKRLIEEHLVLEEEYLRLEIEKHPNDAELYSLLGDNTYRQEDYAATAAIYEKALALDPANAQVLNNLAWLYATCEDERVRNPSRALSLARRAAEIEPESAHILDTLAETYFVNRQTNEAVRYARQALAAADEPKGYYRQQLDRFQQARGTP